MAAPGGTKIRPGGVLRAAGRLILLVGLGFGAGVLIGVISEEPELLVGHLSGESELVPLAILQPKSRTDENTAQSALSESRVEDRQVVLKSPVESTQAQRLALQRETGESTVGSLPRVAAAVQTKTGSKHLEGVGTSTSKREVDQSGNWAIQVGAFANKAAARRLAESLEAKDYPVELIASEGATKRWRVRVQPVRGESKARGIADQLKRDERLPTWMIPLEARSGQ